MKHIFRRYSYNCDNVKDVLLIFIYKEFYPEVFSYGIPKQVYTVSYSQKLCIH